MEVLKTLFHELTLSDVTFVVGTKEFEEKVKAHKNILAVSSPVFYSMFTGNFVEAKEQGEVYIPDVTPSAFKVLIKYIYTKECPIINKDNWGSILYAVEKYQIQDLKQKCIEFVDDNCLIKNACEYFQQGKKFQVNELVPRIQMIIDYNAPISLTSDSLLTIEDSDSLNEILSSDKLNRDEIMLFRSAIKWASAQVKESEEQQSGANLRAILGPALYAIRFSLMSPNEFNLEVIPKDILTDEEIISILKKTSNQFKHESRIRTCYRFKNREVLPLRSKRHSIKFKVDCNVNIHGFLNYYHFNKGDVLEGKMLLKKEGDVILRQKSFKDEYNKLFEMDAHFFTDPISIHPETWYIVQVEFDLINVETRMGTSGSSEVTFHGVKWTFDNDCTSCKETNVNQGQIPGIKFSKIV